MADDHVALEEVLNILQVALDSGDVKTAYAKLDLFWARLAVHIRAEHLHLFPSVSRLHDAEVDGAVEGLRADHDFFMHELGRAIAVARDLLNTADAAAINRGLKTVRGIVDAIVMRLVIHNEVEENQVYRLAAEGLSEQGRVELALRINKELANHPPRFSAEQWSLT